MDQELGIGRRWRTFSLDFSRNWPRYRKELSGFLETPIGRGFATIFFLWFALSGWLFRFFIFATWVLPFAAPLLIGTFANNFAIEKGTESKELFIFGRISIRKLIEEILLSEKEPLAIKRSGYRLGPAQPAGGNLLATKIRSSAAPAAETLYGHAIGDDFSERRKPSFFLEIFRILTSSISKVEEK
ncbi:uncharacterized protein A4U43_C10F3230 [Asparagus officinalis]|uniref:Uncharacterized protein n=1 Tax=Asparagus officinalis TaxID=4686 RepID=A0A5P1E0E0_ASPOF|nr:uncharacterized protein A4U43_C10F3230 [Asparagus officinalis]